MKKFFFVLMTAATFSAGNAQQFPMYTKGLSPVSYSDPALSNLQFANGNGSSANTDHLLIGTPVKMSFTLSNNDALNAVPSGTVQLKITLGSKFRLAGGDDISQIVSLPLLDYFRWSMIPAQRNSQFIITGELIRDLPARFNGQVAFTLMPSRDGGSTVTAQMMISNHDNPITVLSDVAPANNYVYKAYTNAKQSGVKFLQFSANPHRCALDLNWLIADESRMAKRFYIETSADGQNFTTVKGLNATGDNSYIFSLDNVQVKSLTVRIRAELNDGSIVYSNPVAANNICGGTKMDISLYPNPLARDAQELTLSMKDGLFNGKYVLKLTDAAGRQINTSNMTYSNQAQVKYNTGVLSSGFYFITIVSEDGQTLSLPFEKMKASF